MPEDGPPGGEVAFILCACNWRRPSPDSRFFAVGRRAALTANAHLLCAQATRGMAM